MSNLLTSYPIFENNQVLTSSQLNELVAYLDEQNRLTRAKLIGTGIACGFDLRLDQTVTPTEITIFTGMGITSEGFLITEGDCVMHNYRPYNLPAGVRYVPFEDPTTTVQDVTLYELLTDDAPTLPSDVINPLNIPAGFVNDKVVLLFIEIIDVDQKSCIGKSCDTSGFERMFNLRKLLISKTDLDKVIKRTCEQTAAFPAKYDLPEIFMQRVLFNNAAPNVNTSDYFVFSQAYVKAMKSTALPATGITIYDQIFSALKQSYIDFSPILSDQYGGVNPFATIPNAATWATYLSGSPAAGGKQYLGMQYFYDFLKDLILAYNEFRDVAFDLMSECCNDMDCFPQHLMLGEVVPTGSCKPSRYRHYFITSPIFNNQKEKLARTVSLFQRMVLMVNKFDLATINNPNTTIISPNPLAVPIYITPSNEKRDPLSKRAIPYYYRIHETQSTLGTLEQSWNYDFKLKCLFSKGLAPLAYGNQDFSQQLVQGPVKTPLYYDLDPYNFLRIEGHLLADYVKAKQQIEQIKNDFDLPFNVIALRLAGDPTDDITKRCDFDDLHTEYGSIRVEMLSLIQNVFDRFGTISQGAVAVKQSPQFIKSLMADLNPNTLNGSVAQPQIGVTSILNVISDGTGTIDNNGAVAVNNTGEAQERIAFTTSAPVSASAALATVPVYAPQRTLAQVNTKLGTDTLNLLNLLNTLKNTDLPYDMTTFRFGYTGAVADSTPGFIQDYLGAVQAAINVKVGINQWTDLLLRTTKVRNTPELLADLLMYTMEITNLLERFITDAKYKSLTLLNYIWQYRLNYIRTNDMTLFSNFINKNPGIEHKAGVPKNGTFILVYPGNSIAVNPIKRNLAVLQGRELKELTLQSARINAKSSISYEDQVVLAQNEAIKLNYTLVAQEIALPSIPIQRIAIDAHQVVADFTLPYLCCCDCECESIPPPTQQDLGIPALAVPFYASYSLGDYAFGKDVQVGTRTLSPLTIDIIPMLQYDKTLYQETQIRLYLVDKTGNRVIFRQIEGKQVDAYMATGNYPNVPVYNISTGSVTVAAFGEQSKAQQFVYTPSEEESKTFVLDSFYYMFEIVSNDGATVLERSSMGLVTIAL